MGEMKNVPNDQKIFRFTPERVPQIAEAKYETLKAALTGNQTEPAETFDSTLPGDVYPLGSRHPISIVRKISSTFFTALALQLQKARK